jgi:hypothetical protein
MNMTTGRKERKPEAGCAAQVFLRSQSGRSVRSMGEESLPADLAPFRPPVAAKEKVVRLFGDLGFRAYADDLGLTVSIEGPRRLFAKVFGVSLRRLEPPAPSPTVMLKPPGEVRELVEAIVLLPPPEFH